MKTIRILTVQPMLEQPLTWLSQARLNRHVGWSMPDGISGVLYRSYGGGYQVLPPEWSEEDASDYAAMIGAFTTRVDLPDEEADAFIARIDSNITGSSPP